MKFKFLWTHLPVFILGLVLGSGITYRLLCTEENVDSNKLTTSEKISKSQATNPRSTYQGIDVSHHQGLIEWSEVAKDKDIQFVYIKATEGATYRDKRYKENLQGARKQGLLVGSYHYLRNSSTIIHQFNSFKRVVKKELQDLIPMVDVEEKVHKDSIMLFCQLIKEHYGTLPIIYGTNKSYNEFCAPDFNNFYLMIGRYGVKPPVIKGKGHYSIWQYSEKGIVKGIPKPVDLNRFHPDFNLDFIKLN